MNCSTAEDVRHDFCISKRATNTIFNLHLATAVGDENQKRILTFQLADIARSRA